MKLHTLATAFAALALAGVASAQPQGFPPEGSLASGGADQPLSTHRPSAAQAAYRGAVREYQAACASDRETLCGDRKSDEAAGRCLRYHRLKLTAACRTAVAHLDLAERGAL